MKKLLSMLVCMIMVLGMSINVFAATPVSLEITHITKDHTYTAYQIFDGDLTSEGILSNIAWGTGITDGAALINELKADTKEIWNSDKTVSVVIKEEFKDATSAADVADVIRDWSSNGERLDYLAEIFGKYLATGTNSNTAYTDNGNNTYTYKIENLDPGYYLIKDTTVDEKVGAEDYRTKYMLYLTTSVKMDTKGDYTTVDKTVSETLDGTYSESIAEQLNKTYYYKWEAQLDDEIAWYDTYYLEFEDHMSAGIKFEKLEEVYILEADNNKVYLYKDNAWVVNSEAGINSTPSVNSVETTGTGTTVKLGWNNLKTAYTSIAGDDVVVVKYSATLNENAVYGVAGNPNQVFIKFSNSPSDNGHGESVPDDANVFSFQLLINKVDADNHENKLAGAEFYFYHMHGSEKHYAIVNNGKITSWVPDTAESIAKEIKELEEDTILDDSVKATKIAELVAKPVATKLVTQADGTFGYNLQGLKDGTIYYLHEVKAPSSYNLMFTDVSIAIHPNYVTDANGKVTYDKLTYLVDGNDVVLNAGDEFTHGIVKATVLNDRGNTLPSTGGIGTTIFYAAGGVLVTAAVVWLVTKKRMSVNK